MNGRQFYSILFTVSIFLMLYLSQFGTAVLVQITTDKSSYGTADSMATFTLGVDLDVGERIPIGNLTLSIVGPTNVTCAFNPAGTNLTACSGIVSITAVNVLNYTNGSRWGYDYLAGTNHTFTSGYGYAYLAGYGWSDTWGSELYYNITWNITLAGEGSYNATLSAYVADGSTSHSYVSNVTSFSILSGALASFTGQFNDATDDADNDTAYDHLIVTVGVNVTANGTYKITGRLDAPRNGGYVDTWPIAWEVNNTELYAGQNNVTLIFEGQDISRRQINGPYILKYLRIYDSSWTLLDVRDNSYNTSAYNYSQFEQEAGSFTASSGWGDRGVDTNSDGEYDYLEITVGVNITNAGIYRIEGIITEAGTGLGVYAINRTNLTTGVNNVSLYFDGLEIASKSLNGPYLLWVVRLVDVSKATWLTLDKEANYYLTSAYNSTQFSTPSASFTGNYWDAGSDGNNNSLYDYLNITVEINSSGNRTYTVRGRLAQYPLGHVTWEKVRVNLTAGLNNVTLQWDGMLLSNLNFNGNYSLRRLLLADVTGGIWVQTDDRFEAHITVGYNSSQFESPNATLTSPYSDQGVDTDSDGKYNYLGFTTGVNVSANGLYLVRAELVDPTQTDYLWGWKRHMMWANNLSNLSSGYNNVTLYFDGQRIRSGGWNGNFQIRHLILYAVSGNLSHYTVDEINPLDRKYYPHTTGNYSTSNFDAPAAQLTGTYIDYGKDLDSDGQYDYLSIDVGLTVNEQNYYLLEGTLVDIIGTYKETADNRSLLYANTTNVTLDFDGMLIRNTGADYFYRLNTVLLKVLPGNNLSNSTLLYGVINAFTTAHLFNASQFETPYASLAANSSSYSDYAVDTNGNSLYDKLIVNASVQIRENGVYIFEGLLKTPNNERTFGAVNLTTLTAGNRTIPLMFNGRKIREAGINGPYTVNVVRVAKLNVGSGSTWRLLDKKSDIYVTQAYNYTQFET
ncbi:MAG: hypothetical protein V1921_00080 [Candidatus Altiarchaeota archaeon]